MIRPHLTHILILAAGLIPLFCGCGEQIEVANSPAELISLGPPLTIESGATDQRFKIPFVLQDQEGDDQELRLEICESADGTTLTKCGFPYQGEGSDGIGFIFTPPFNRPITHQFVWDVGCGRISSEGMLIETETALSYVVRGQLDGTSEVKISEAPFTLADAGLATLPECGR